MNSLFAQLIQFIISVGIRIFFKYSNEFEYFFYSNTKFVFVLRIVYYSNEHRIYSNIFEFKKKSNKKKRLINIILFSEFYLSK